MTTSQLPAGYPQSDLTLSAAPDNNPDTTLSPTCACQPSQTEVRRPGPKKSPHRPRVIEQLRLGVRPATIAREHGITRDRVRQMWLSETGLPTPKPTPAEPKPVIDRAANKVRRFWARVSVAESGCWLWTGARYPTGYGHTNNVTGSGYAHRDVYELLVGPIPAGLTIDHLCRVPACVNPSHLEAVTQRENTLRSPIAPAAINARKTHCKRGHEFTPANTLPDSHTPRQRRCRACNAFHQRQAYARRIARQRAVA